MNKLIYLLPLFWLCSSPNRTKEVISNNAILSACEGFKTLPKAKPLDYKQDTLDYCGAEKLRWQYNASNKVLSFFHTRNKQNCGAKLQMIVIQDGNRYVFEEHDNGNSNLDCLCYFDTYCEILNIEGDNVKMCFELKNYSLFLAQEKGLIVIDSTRTWPCLGQL